MRDECKIQAAHDILHAVVAGEVQLDLKLSDLERLHLLHDAISWVLEGPCGSEFQANIAGILRAIIERDYRAVSQP